MVANYNRKIYVIDLVITANCTCLIIVILQIISLGTRRICMRITAPGSDRRHGGNNIILVVPSHWKVWFD